MSQTQDVLLSVVVMHHPARAELLPDLLGSCASLHPRVVEDPDPSGPPSALRTAKRAWAAVAEGATHHLVLQDDVCPVPGFAEKVMAAIRERPADGLTLYVNWDSPQNSYLTRRAAMVGSAWGPLSPYEWTPTLGLVLPAADAIALAEYLAALPDDGFWGDDDEAVVAFCNRRGLRVVSTIPHLLDHSDHPSLADNDQDGSRHATVLLPDPALAAAAPSYLACLELKGDASRPLEFVVQLQGERCLMRFVRPGAAEYVSHPFGWYWYDWCGVVGLDRDLILDCFDEYFVGSGLGDGGLLDVLVAAEVWAAGYLLGVDVARLGLRSAAERSVHAPLRSAALGSWVDSGVHQQVGPQARAAYVETCTAAFACAVTDHGDDTCRI